MGHHRLGQAQIKMKYAQGLVECLAHDKYLTYVNHWYDPQVWTSRSAPLCLPWFVYISLLPWCPVPVAHYTASVCSFIHPFDSSTSTADFPQGSGWSLAEIWCSTDKWRKSLCSMTGHVTENLKVMNIPLALEPSQ